MARKVDVREPVQRFLIVCEGKETEPLYFRAFRVPGDVISIEVKGLGRGDPCILVAEAIKLKEMGDYDQVWCVFDIDDNSACKVNKALLDAKFRKIKFVYSNQKFELWYLLHFAFIDSAIDRNLYDMKLSNYLGIRYNKALPNMYSKLGNAKQETAILNARKLLARYTPPDPCRDDPSTTVYQLVEELNKYTPDSRR